MNNLTILKPFPHEKYELIKSIYKRPEDSSVSIMKHKAKNTSFIIKKLNLLGNDEKQILNEIEIGDKLDHKNFSRTLKAYFNQDKGKYYLVIEYIENGVKLCDFLKQHKKERISFEDFKKIITQLFQAIIYCLGKEICPLDVTEGNLLIDSEKKITLIDFGKYRKFPFTMFRDMGHQIKECVLDILKITSIGNEHLYLEWEKTLRAYAHLDSTDDHIKWCNNVLSHPFLKNEDSQSSSLEKEI